MKKNIILAMCALASLAVFTGCNGCNNNQNANRNANTANNRNHNNERVEQRREVRDERRQDRDIRGTYTATLPCADCDGIETEIVLEANDNYRIKRVYKGNNDSRAFESTGRYTWSNDGNVITLEGETAPNRYRVNNNTLTQLDMNGNTITGNQADMYVLRRR